MRAATRPSNRAPRDEGFSLVEVLVASLIMTTALAALTELFVIAAGNNARAGTGTIAQVLAAQKMEQLRGLTWGYDANGLAVSDLATDTARSPAPPSGGSGLRAAPSGTLQVNTNGYVDYLDAGGRSLGGGASVPAGAVFIRRWAIVPLPADSADTLVLQVLVTRNADRGGADAGWVRRLPDEARLITLKTRKGS